jgi:hypothetical protein
MNPENIIPQASEKKTEDQSQKPQSSNGTEPTQLTVSPQTYSADSQVKTPKYNSLKNWWYIPVLFAVACLIIFIYWQSKWLLPILNNNYSYTGPYCDSGVCTPAVNIWLKISTDIYYSAIVLLVILMSSYVVINLRKYVYNLLRIIKTIIRNHSKLTIALISILILFTLMGGGFKVIPISAVVLVVLIYLAAIYSNKILPLKLMQHLSLGMFYKSVILLSVVSVAVVLTGIIAASKSGCIQNNSNDPSDSSTTYYSHCVIPGDTSN